MRSILGLLVVFTATKADISHLFGSSNSYLPPQREPHHRYGAPAPVQQQLPSNSDIPESFFRIDNTISAPSQSNIYQKPVHSYIPPPSGPAQQQQVEVHVVQLPISRPQSQYLPPVQKPIYRQPPVFQPGPIYRQQPIYRQPAPVYRQPIYRQPNQIYRQPTPIYRQPIIQPAPVLQPAPVFQQTYQPSAPIQQTYQQDQQIHTSVNYRPNNQYLPPVQSTIVTGPEIIQPQQSDYQQPIPTFQPPSDPIPTFQPPSDNYLPPIESKNVYTTTQQQQIAQPSIPVITGPSYTEPEPAHTFGPDGYNYRRP